MTNIFSTLFRSARERRAYGDLMNLDEHLLRDIGLTRIDVRNMIRGKRRVVRTHE